MELGSTINQVGQYETVTKTRRNTLVVGKSRTGKTTALVRWALNDIYNGLPVVFIDPVGSAVDELLSHIPASRQEDVLLIDPSSVPFALNFLHDVPKGSHPLVASTIYQAIKSVWIKEDTSTPNIEKYIRGGIQTLLQVPDATLVSLKFLLTSEFYRTFVLKDIKDFPIKDFWEDYETLSFKDRRQETASTLNKLWAFVLEPRVRNCIDQKDTKLILKDKIVLVSLRESFLGENTALLGALILAQLYIEGVQGLDQNVYIRNAPKFGTTILAMLMANCPYITTFFSAQYLDQFSRSFQSTAIGAVGQIVAFRSSIKDAKVLEPEFNLSTGDHLYTLDPYRAFLARDGVNTPMYMEPHTRTKTHQERKIRARCASQYTMHPGAAEKRVERFDA